MLPKLKLGKLRKKEKERSEWIIMLVSLILAFFIWSMYNLSADYSVYFHYKVNITSNLEGRVSSSRSEDILMLRGKATGFYILKHRYGNRNLVTLALEEKQIHSVEGDDNRFYIMGSEVREKIIEALSSDVSVEYIATELMSFNLPKINNKRVPIVVKTSFSFKEQYMQKGGIRIRPDSVTLYGEDKYISTIDSLYTETISLSNISSSAQGMVKLMRLRGVRTSQEQVYYSFDVDRYVEESLSIPLKIINLPEGKDLICIPSEVVLKYRVSFSDKKQITREDFTFSVDYKDYINTIDSKVFPKVQVLPASVFTFSIDPPFVECVELDYKRQ